MKGASLILAAVAVIAIAADFRAEGQAWLWDTPTEEPKNCCDPDFLRSGQCDKWVECASTAAPTISPTTDRAINENCKQGFEEYCTLSENGLCFKWEPCDPAGAPTISPTTDRAIDEICVRDCPRRVVSTYNPVCGNDENTYDNLQHLNCVRDQCGKSGLKVVRYQRCKPLI